MNPLDRDLLNCRIAAIQGASSATIQAFLERFAAQAAREGYRIAGVVEVAAGESAGGCKRFVRDLATGAVTSISQDLGPHATACNLDPSGLAEACAAVERAIATGADLVILSKFGKLEAERAGLSAAFHAAVSASLPILTAVSPAMSDSWQLFAGPLSCFLPPDATLLDAWWSNVRTDIPHAA